MSGRKAPRRKSTVLSALLDDLWLHAVREDRWGDVKVIKLAALEFKALRMVRTAADRAEILHQHKGEAGTVKRCAGCTLMRALARLERASGTTKRERKA